MRVRISRTRISFGSSTSTAPTGMLRAVLDTNIYIAAFLAGQGPNAALWNAAGDRQYVLLVSPAIIAEIAAVLRARFGWPEALIQRHIKQVAHVSEVVRTVTRINMVPDDPTDNRILECAVDGQADVIVSNDHHLLALKSYNNIPIVAGPDFRHMLAIA